MNICEYAHLIVFSNELESKLLSASLVDSFDYKPRFQITEIPDAPARNEKIKISDEKIKFPTIDEFEIIEKRAQALHSFANHELLAIEMMAMAIIYFPLEGPEGNKFRKSLLATILDEQKHFKLYSGRLDEYGYKFGDFPLNDFFWRQMKNITSPEQFYAVMALTFESANLDFMLYYEQVFKSVGDLRTASILRVVFEDEVAHVRLGKKWIEDSCQLNEDSLWEKYCDMLPEKLSPARAKGVAFDEDARRKVGLGDHFIQNLKKYKDKFKVVNRKK